MRCVTCVDTHSQIKHVKILMAECDKRQLDSVQHSVLKDDPQDEDDLSHMEVIVKVQEHIKNLMKDPFLSDLPSGVSLDKVQSQLALEEGRAITVNIRRYDDIVIRKFMKIYLWLLGTKFSKLSNNTYQ